MVLYRRLGAALVGLLLVGCGLDESGIVSGDGGPSFDASVDTQSADSPSPSDSPAVDVTSDVAQDVSPPEAGVCDTDANECQPPEVPAGWNPVAYVENPQSGCPADWSTADDYVTNVGNGTATCGCSCAKTADPNCTTGWTNTASSYYYGCGTPGLSFNFTNGACIGLNGPLDNYFSGTKIQPSSGKCTVQGTSGGTLQTTPARLCIPDAMCNSAACGGVAPAGFAACIVADNDQLCPSGSSFSIKHPVAKSATPSCTQTCGTGCTFQGTCDTPQLHTFTDTGCTSANGIVTLASDGTCVATNHGGTIVRGVTYSATPNFTGCTATGSSTLQPTLTTPRTVCCR